MIVATFADAAMSGSDANRPQYRTMLEAAARRAKPVAVEPGRRSNSLAMKGPDVPPPFGSMYATCGAASRNDRTESAVLRSGMGNPGATATPRRMRPISPLLVCSANPPPMSLGFTGSLSLHDCADAGNLVR